MKQGESVIRGLLPFFVYLLSLAMWIMFGCTDPQGNRGPYSLDDEALSPFVAMYQVDREQFCLTEIDPDSKVEIIRADSASRGYDVALRMYGDGVSRSIAFVWENGQYVWIGEKETHYSGRKYKSFDGTAREEIIITYHKRRTYGGPVGQIILYSGDDESIPPFPTCDQALSYIREWDARRVESDNN